MYRKANNKRAIRTCLYIPDNTLVESKLQFFEKVIRGNTPMKNIGKKNLQADFYILIEVRHT